MAASAKISDYIGSFATQILVLVLGFGSGILTSRLLGPQGRGELAILQYYPGLAGSIFGIGMPQAISMLIARDPSKSAEVTAAAVRLSFFLAILACGGFAVVAPYTLASRDPSLASAVTMSCLAAPAMIVNPFLWAIHRGYHRFLWVNAILILLSVASPTATLLLWSCQKIDPFALTLAGLGVQSGLMLLNLGHIGTDTLLRPVAWSTYRECILLGLKNAAPAIAACLYAATDRPVLMHATTAVELGYFAVAFGLAFPITSMSEPFVQIGFVEIAGSSDKGTAKALFVRRVHMAQVTLFLMASAAALVVYPVVRFAYGRAFMSSIPVACVLMAAMVAAALSKLIDNGLRAREFWGPGVATNLVGILCLAAIGVILARAAGARGMAFAFLITESVKLAVVCALAGRRLNVGIAEWWGLRPSVLRAFVTTLSKHAKQRLALSA